TVGIFQTTVDAPGRLRRIDPALRNANLLFAARNGDVWVAAPDRFGYFRGDTFTSRLTALGAGESVTAMAEQPDGAVWLGTSCCNCSKTRQATCGWRRRAACSGCLAPICSPAYAARTR